MAWERTRASESGINGYPFAICAAVGSAIVVGPGLGGWILADEGLWAVFVVGEVLDLAAAVAFAVWAGRTYHELKQQYLRPIGPHDTATDQVVAGST